MKILILGASGTIGKAIYQCLSAKYDAFGTFHKNKPKEIDDRHLYRLDIDNLTTLDNILNEAEPDVIISSLCGDFDHQLAVHERAAEYLHATEGSCVFLSTANVFDGSPDSSHTEKEVPYPISQYGKYKYSCEQLLQGSLEDKCLIVRLPRTLSYESTKETMRQVEEGQAVFTNLIKSLNTADNVAQSILYCIETGKRGVIHMTSTDTISDDDFIKLLQAHSKKSFSYETDAFTLESYCKALGCNNPELVRLNPDGQFYLSLSCADSDFPDRYKLTCNEVVLSLS